MSIDRFKTHGSPNDEVNFFLRDPDREYEHSDVVELLEEAERLGFSLEKGSELSGMTVRELDRVVRVRQ